MELSKQKLQTSESQIPGSSSSLSVPAELPDVGNWFASYQYESPVMNSDSFRNVFDAGESKRVEDEGISCGFREIGNKDGVFVHKKKKNSDEVVKCGNSSGDQCLTKISGSSGSALSLSAPTDIKNWFSSYVYESPSLDTSDGFEDSLSKQSKRKKDGVMVDKRQNEEELRNLSIKRSVSKEDVGEKEQSRGLPICDSSWRVTKQARQPVSEVPGPLDCSSHLSEPTDIRNWFSSYVYDSPSLDTADGFGDFVCRHKIDEKDKVLVETSNQEKRVCLEGFSKIESKSEADNVEKIQSEEQEKPLIDSTTGVDENLSGENDLCLEYGPKTVQSNDISQAKHGDTLSFNKGHPQCKSHQETFHGTRFKSSSNQRRSCSDDGKCPQNLIHCRGSALQESSEAKVNAKDCLLLATIQKLIPVNEASVSNSGHGSKEITYDGESMSEDGFITTRKRKFTAKNDENSSKGPPKSNKGSVTLAGKDAVIERISMADTTNFHHSPAPMITGKWKCPQQRKPNLAPPLKQLGLEHWFRKS